MKVKFVDFWPGFDEKDNFITRLLKKHYTLEFTDEPEYLFYSCFGTEYLNYDCIRIFYTGENVCPDFNLCDYGIGFEYMDYGERYLKFPQFCLPQYQADYEAMKTKHLNAEMIARTKTDFCSMVVSSGVKPGTNFGCAQIRDTIFDVLSTYKKVNSGGRYRNNIGQPEGVKDKAAFQRTHKFALCFENCSHEGYTTEKIVQAFAAGAVPIYWGDPRIGEQFNEKAFINCNEYSSLEEVLERVKEIDQSDALYLRMLHEPALKDEKDLWQSSYTALENWLIAIVEKPVEKAYQRTRVAFQANYERQLKEWKSFYRYYEKYRNLKYRLTNLIKGKEK